MDEAQGKDLFKDFALLAAKENLSEPDRKKILELSHFLAGLHQEKAAENKDSLYKRTLRSAVGGNTSIMSIIDLYPKDLNWVSEEELQKIIALKNLLRIKNFFICRQFIINGKVI